MPAADTVFDQVLDQIRREFQLIIEKQDLFHLGRSERFAEILFCDIEELYDLIIALILLHGQETVQWLSWWSASQAVPVQKKYGFLFL